jgi:hypothetical protein
MKYTARREIASLVLMMAVLSASCATGTKQVTTPSVPTDPKQAAYERLVDGAARVASVVSASLDVVVALKKDGSITREQEVQITRALRAVNTPNGVLVKQLKNYSTLDELAKTSLSGIAAQVITALQDFNNAKLFGIKNPIAVERVNAMLGTLLNLTNVFKTELGV